MIRSLACGFDSVGLNVQGTAGGLWVAAGMVE